MKRLEKRELKVMVFGTRSEMGLNAATMVSRILEKLLQHRDEVNVVFAAAPSQDEFLDALSKVKDVEWHRINAFHLDEYIGLPSSAPQRFSKYLDKRIFERVPFRSVNYVIPAGLE
ncbi:MAG TPA: glucosamine-6-phosphate deaminase, partial [Thermotogaceae bacterium]|nr:glucosamine-6-phosphate deaminase [Thermotogaceae bacterium]